MSHQCQHTTHGACRRCAPRPSTTFAEWQENRRQANIIDPQVKARARRTNRRLGSNKPTKWSAVIRFPLV